MSEQKHKSLNTLILVISIALPIIVAVLFGMPKLNITLPFDIYLLPLTNAILNGTCALLLVAALVAAKSKNIKLHSRLIYLAMAFSLAFLLLYIFYHMTTEHTKFCGEGTVKLIYLILLLTHIALAAIQAPLVLYAFLYGYTGQIERHKKLVKFSYPVWLYVSVTGVICYLMIAPCYGQ